MSEREMPFSSINTLSTERVNPDFVLPDERETRVGLFIPTPAGIAIGALKFAGNILRRPVRAAAGLTAAALAIGYAGGGGSVSADLDAAQTTMKAELIQFTSDAKFEAATASWSVEMAAEKIPFIVDQPVLWGVGPDLTKDCERNKFLKGVGTNEFKVPFTAVTSVEGEGGKTDFVVDASKLAIKTFWEGKGPSVVNFELTGDGKRDFGDQGDFCQQFLDFRGSIGNQELQNLKVTLDNRVEDDMKLKGLQEMTESCAPQLNSEVREAIVDTLEENVKMMGKSELMGEVSFKPDTFKWNEVKIPEPLLKKVGDASFTYQLKEEGFKVDKVVCNLPPKVVEGGNS